MDIDRHLDWDGCVNVRDLGGLPARGGRTTRRQAFVRADNIDRLTASGWDALLAHGVRTVVDLREADERTQMKSQRPEEISTVHVPLDDNADFAFWYSCVDGDIDGTPLYYRPFVERKAERCVAALTALAEAADGGVVVHCGIGRDRTGLIAILLLALAGVETAAIAADYCLSTDRLKRHFGRDDDPIAARLAERGTTVAATIEDLLTVDLQHLLLDAGLRSGHVATLQTRLLGPGLS